ncbi:hypothetical protein OROHE_027117 [Orobanche hederae]
MFPNYVTRFPIENLSLSNIHLTVVLLGLMEFILLSLLIDTKRIYNFLSGFHSSIHSHLILASDARDRARTNGPDSAPSINCDKISIRRDPDIVLKSLAMSLNSDEAESPPSLDEDDIFKLFEEKNPCSDEVKQAFDVFDSNRDGFIDATELQKVLCALGLEEGLEIDNCRRMIGVFDENGDGMIDLDEFVKILFYGLRNL